MPPRKRARSSTGSTSAAASEAVPLVQLGGGEPLPSKLVRLWRSGRLADTTVKVEGSSFVAHKVVLAAGSAYFERLFESPMSDANAPALSEVSASAFGPLLDFLYQGSVEVEEGLLTPLLRAAN